MSATFSAPFDAYHKWLGIPPADQPPTHYRLLGLEACESDLEVIAGAADARLAQLRTYQAGRHARESQRLLNEVSAARTCLLDHARKADYDRQIKWPRRGETRISSSPPVQPPPAAAPVVRERSPAEMPPLVVAVQCTSPSQQFSRRRRSRLSPAGWFLVGFATFSAMLFGMAISALVYWTLFRLPQWPDLAAPQHPVAPVVAESTSEDHLPLRGHPSAQGGGTGARLEAFTVNIR
jgi:hypothetical protein